MDTGSIVTLIGIIVTAAVSLIGIFTSAKSTRDEVTKKLDVNQHVMDQKIAHIKETQAEMKADIRDHNHYAQMFSENIPVVKEQINAVNEKVNGLEVRVNTLESKL